MSRTRAILIAIDQLLAAIIVGYPDPTLSAVAYVWERDGVRVWPRKAIDVVFGAFGDKNHCHESYNSELLQRQFPPGFFG